MIYRYHEPTDSRYLWAPALGFWIRIEGQSTINEHIRDMLAKWGGEKWQATYNVYLREGADNDGIPFDGDMFQPPRAGER